MERIQSAIAKARETRGSARQGVAPRHPVQPEAATPRSEAWAAIPPVDLDLRRLKENRVVALGGGPEVTPFDIMRTRTVQQMRPKEWKRLAITSPTPGCGKSMISANLALSLTRQPETSVILIEMDMRRPTLAQTLGLDVRHSVADLLTGEGEMKDNAVRFGDNLIVATSSAPAHNPSDLLQSASIGQFLSDLETRFTPTFVIFDTPPLLVNDDTLAFLGHADCALLVAAAEMTSIKEIDRCEREITAHTDVLGVILNKCRYMNGENPSEYY